jgi:hypothetical protein
MSLCSPEPLVTMTGRWSYSPAAPPAGLWLSIRTRYKYQNMALSVLQTGLQQLLMLGAWASCQTEMGLCTHVSMR